MSSKLIKNLFKPLKVGDLTLSNKISMSAMTRLRADPKTDIPNDLHVEYYSQRAAAGLILSEGTPISKLARGVEGAGSLYTSEQVKGWKKVTDAVHSKGGKIFAQLWHGGRSAHAQYGGGQPFSASGLKIRDQVQGGLPYEEPKAMTKDDIKMVVEEFRNAAENARQAGFDGVELHGGYGYLIDEFLKDHTNKRTDEYGGISVENRARFPLEVMNALISVWGKDRVGIKISPAVRYQDVYDSDPVATYSYLLKELDKKGIAFVEIVESSPGKSTHYGPGIEQLPHVTKTFRPYFKGPIMINSGLSPESAAEAIESGDADFASFGRLYLSNPDLVERVKNGWPLAQGDFNTFYFGGAKGYTDYPAYKKEQAK